MDSRLSELSRITTEKALHSGALLPVSTTVETIEEKGLQYQLRTLSSLKHKQNQQRIDQAGSVSSNPFKPYDPALYVADIGCKHICLLNKFNVLENHLLLVTRDFHNQTEGLNVTDFYAAMVGLTEIDGLVFYNGGKEAGASQPHKHLQLVPIIPEQLPLYEQLKSFNLTPSATDKLPFNHLGIRLPRDLINSPKQAAGWLYIQYLRMLDLLSIQYHDKTVITPYNLLLTREWLMMVPRSKESVTGISFNSLAFVGALLVKSPEQAEQIKALGISKSLHSVTGISYQNVTT